MLALCQADALLRRTPQVAISIVTLDDLLTKGPWATTFQRLHADQSVPWTGEPA